ncbi:MAG: alpha/beta hydrolase [Bacteroidales bacterium]
MLRRLLSGIAIFTMALGATIAAERQVIQLWPEGVPRLRSDAAPDKVDGVYVSGVHYPSITVYAADKTRANGTAVIVCPGGSYMRQAAEHEGTQVAEWLNSLGVTAFLLRYRMVEYGHPAPLQDVLRAIRMVRSRAAEFNVRADRVGVCGASAGGHLASTAATLFDDPDGKTGAHLDAVSARPDFAILLYPVITMKDPFTHAGSRRALLGEAPDAVLVGKMSTDLQVSPSTPPTFIVHAEDDTTVPLENTLQFYQALRKAGVAAELHVYEHGGHGFGMRPGVGQASTWPQRCAEWMRSHGWLSAGS